ncbi:MAG: Ferredoxin--NADP reductase [Firmicutes bacterium]|nr:Ferredoxin--NADP reductase [candidate division NPL-UPA2 bacterium]
MIDVLVVGGGAAGLSAAIAAGRAGAKVVVLEKRDRLGKKILASGNGRCNLSNLNLSPGHFVSHDLELLSPLLEKFSVRHAYAYWQELGLELTTEDGRVYPRTMQAKSVLEVLSHELTRLNVDITLSAPVTSIKALDGRTLEIMSLKQNPLRARSVVLATGGKAAPQLGCSGDGYTLAAGFGHTVVAPAPALVGLRLASPYLKLLSGLRLQARVSIPELAREEAGEVLFTDYGISGIPVFDLTAYIGHGKSLTLHLCLAEQTCLADLLAFLEARLELLAHKNMHDALQGYVPTHLITPLLREAGLPPDLPAHKAPGHPLIRLASLLWDWTFPILGLNTWEQAQTTWGGVPLGEVEVPSLRSKKHPGLFLAGELLDVHGRCGGYNLHWAFASGNAAGESAALSAQH